MVVLTLSSCSLKKNTGLTRFWHSLNTRYNIYYNGAQAYIEGSKEKESGNKDNYTERIPLYTVGNKASRDLGKGNFDVAITKAEKAIQLHSIKTKPEWTKNRRKTERDIEWLARKEYNPFLWRAWMLMGRSQFYKGEFDEAAATFSYMSRLYKGQPAIYGKARAWLAKCYIESDWLYDAEDIIRSQMRDSIDWRAQKEWDYTLCDYYLHTENLSEAAKYLRRVIKHEMRRKQKAREYFLLGQIEAAQGNKQAAYEAFRHVPRLNPPYELAFNARIAMTEVLAQGQAKKMIGRLRRMARDENNKEYLDQVYYAMGNIYLAEKDTASAISAYEKGNEKATRSGIEKGVLLLHLGDLYWIQEKYSDAKRCYGEAIGLLDKERPDYDQLSKRSKVLDELVPFTDAIHLQDSLLMLADLPEKERLEAIDRVIKQLKEREKKEEAMRTETEIEKRQQIYGNNPQNANTGNVAAASASTSSQQGDTWYFYNTQAVIQGKQAFQRMWGRRENVDDWQRNNRTVVAGVGEETTDSVMNSATDSLQTDSINSENAEQDSLALDPHNREYYLAQIPFTEEQKAGCHKIIKESLIKSAIIFKDKLDNLRLSEKQFTRLRHDYTDYEPKDEVYYHLFLLHSRKDEHDVAATFIDSLKAYCPDSKYTAILTDPYFAENAKFGKHIEDSLYAATYEAFKADRFQEVYSNVAVSEERFPLGENRDRFIFFYGMTKLNDGDASACMEAMQKIVTDYPESGVSELAGMIINGVKAGKKLHGAKFDLSDVWNRRDMTLSETAIDSTRTFSEEKNSDYLFIMAYAPDSLEENKLLFQMARYNFTSFMVRNFDIEIDELYGMRHMIVSGFRNFDEARAYSRLLLQQESIRQVMGKARPIVISEENLELIGTKYSYNDYDTFYVKHFAPLPLPRPEGLYDAIRVKESQPTTITQRTDEEGEPTADPVDYDPIKPILPTEEVAPGGAKPVNETKKEDDAEQTDENGTVFDISNDVNVTQTDNGMEIVTEDSTEDAKDVNNDLPFDLDKIPEEMREQVKDMFKTASDSKEDDGIYIPTTEPEGSASEDNALDIPMTEAEGSASEDNALDIPMTEAESNAQEDNALDIPMTEAESSASEDNALDIPMTEAESSASEDNALDIPMTEPKSSASKDSAFDIPMTEPEGSVSEDNALDIPMTEPESNVKEDEGFELPIDETSPKEKEDEGLILDDSTAETEQSDDGTIEFVDDSETSSEDNNNDGLIDIESTDSDKLSTRDIEDEYYELEGF